MIEQANLNEGKGKKWSCFSCGATGVVLCFLFMLFIAVTTPCFLRARPKANFTAGVQQLKNIASGMEQEISEKGSLKGVKSEDDICHHILSGFKEARACKGEVKKRVDEICLPDTLSVKVLGDFSYEIRAQSNEKTQCRICVTEKAVRPERYLPGDKCQQYDCVH